MQITPKTVSITNFSKTQRFVKSMASRGIVPLIMLEAFVEGGRTYQAYKRGGFDEGRERITEEMIGAFFWFSGVKSFNKMIDHFVGKKLLKLPHTDFDGTGDALRKPLKNYINSTGIKEKKIANFKFAKIASSILLANALVGFLVPKLNQHITNWYRRNKKPAETTPQTRQDTFLSAPDKVNMDGFLNTTNNKKEENKNPAFNGLMGHNTLLSLANHFENDAKYQLLSTDVGIASGRAICARNNHERTEILIRDLTSIYFYMFNMPNINRWLNQLEDGRKTRLDPVSAQYATNSMVELVKANGGKMKASEFESAILGNNNNVYKISENLNAKFENGTPNVIKLDTLLDEAKKLPGIDYTKFEETARKMADLQPEADGIKYLTKPQVKDVLRGGIANSPEFLDNLFELATVEDIPFKKNIKSNRKNPYKFVAQAELDGVKEDLVHFIRDIVKRAKEGDVTEEILKKACRNNLAKNALNWGTGFVISAAFLSTFIPKIQYWVTRKVTGQNNFPGTTDYTDENKKK